ncbi:MAG: nucleotide sugar dehydrogenase, partial [Chloroflexi bacterium]|nr:nucleotide sugar dehydrogenase [Chloroflexota bacterium]
MRISVIGSGYVGLVTSACLSDEGHQITCVDVDKTRVSQLSLGILPFHEPDLGELVRRQLDAGNLSFTEDLAPAVSNSQIVFITVGTPSYEDGSVDLSAVLTVAEGIGRAIEGYLVIVIKSTVPVGTAELVRHEIAQYARADFAVLSNPEFLREGQAVRDFLEPDRVIIGGADEQAVGLLRELFASFATAEKILIMDSRSAEMAKYTANAFLATRISFINEMAGLCEGLGVDIERVRQAVGMDPRIGQAYFSPGLGYGGSCLPKDLRAVLAMGRQRNLPL